MNFIKTELEGAIIIEPRVFSDSRGYFFESFSQREFEENVCGTIFVQDNESRSEYGVVRGLHFQNPPYSQAKLVSVALGHVLDVAVDLRKGSPTFGKHIAVELSDQNHRRLFIPKGFAHGFSVLSPIAIFQYKCDAYYNKESEGGIIWNDPSLNIDWKVPAKDVILSEKDKDRHSLDQFDSPF